MSDALTRQVGPFPVWGWLGIGVAGVGLGLLIRRSGVFAGGSLDEEPGDDGGGLSAPAVVAQGGQYGTPVLGVGGVVALPAGNAPRGDDIAPTAEADTNARWLSRAVAWASSSQGISAIAADTALRKALAGRVVDQPERAILDTVIAQWGPPPEGMPPLDVEDPPPAAPTGPRLGAPGDVWFSYGTRQHTTTSGDTWRRIAADYYANGRVADRGALQMGFARIKEANQAVVAQYPDPDQKLPGGITVRIP